MKSTSEGRGGHDVVWRRDTYEGADVTLPGGHGKTGSHCLIQMMLMPRDLR